MTAKDSTVLANRGVKQFEVWFPDPQATCNRCGAQLEDYHYHEVAEDDEDLAEKLHEFEMAKGNVHKSNESDFDNRTGKRRQRISAL